MAVPVSTAEARAAATPKAQKGLRDILKQLVRLGKREERMNLLLDLKKSTNPETQHFLKITKLREEQHRILMHRIVPVVNEIVDKNRKPHDFSKDDLFFFASAAYFDGDIKGGDMERLVREELRRHHTQEAHHPEFEMYNQVECSTEDITEMAIDRLARNAQYGNGIIDLEVIRKFMPKFARGDSDTKAAVFWEAVLKNHDLVQEMFFETFPDARDWAHTNPQTHTTCSNGLCCVV